MLMLLPMKTHKSNLLFSSLLPGDELNDVVNCFDGAVMEKMPIRYFWRGFEKFKERPVCKEPVALLKLKVGVLPHKSLNAFNQ